jgi:hypothetical protein
VTIPSEHSVDIQTYILKPAHLTIFLSISPNQIYFGQMFAWSQLDFSAITVSISAGRHTWQNVNSKRRLQIIQNV